MQHLAFKGREGFRLILVKIFIHKDLQQKTSLAHKLHSETVFGGSGAIDRGAILWNLTGDIVTRKPGRTLLPVLTVLFVVSYGLLTMLVVEQGRTIDSQRNLIRMLFDDSIELNGMKGKANQKQQADARAQAQAQSKMKTPPSQAPQMQASPSPSPQAGAKSQSTSKFRPIPQKPPKDTSDQGDVRRMLITI